MQQLAHIQRQKILDATVPLPQRDLISAKNILVADWLRFIAAAIATAAAFDIDANGVGPTVVGGVDDKAVLTELAEKPCEVFNRRSNMSDESPKTVLRYTA